MEDFNKQKIVWSDIAIQKNTFIYDKSNFFVLNTSYIMTVVNDNISLLYHILGFLNSNIASFYANIITNTLGENGHRLFKQYVEMIPIPIFKNNNISSVIEKIYSANDISKYDNNLNIIISNIFQLSEEESNFINN